MKIFVYKGEGVSPFSLRQALSSLKRALPEATVKPVDAQALTNGEWALEATLLVIPGGRDIFYHHALQGAANQNIRRFVEEGGAYLGLCAGAYYASEKVIFEEGHPSEIIGERELGFFPGNTVGSLFAKTFTYQSEASAEAATLTLGELTLSCYYNGGCLFDGAHLADHTEVLARYADLPNHPAAVVRCLVGQGVALLSGVHLEHSYSALKKRPLPDGLLSHFEQSEGARHTLFNRWVRELVGLEASEALEELAESGLG